MSDPQPYFRAHVFCCNNQRPQGHERGCCADKGANRLREYLKKRVKELGLPDVRVNASGCLDRCELGPCVVIYPEGIWYAPKNEADCDEIVATHLQGGGRVERLMLPGKYARRNSSAGTVRPPSRLREGLGEGRGVRRPS